MKLEWLEDLIAVIETGSLSRAARKRHLTQPAFTRRIQSIERHIGAELLDRSRKPLQLKPSVLNNENRIRELARSLRSLSLDLRDADNVEPLLVLGCQHSISTAVAPALVKALSESTDARIRIRSANRDECYALLLTGEVDIALMYQTENETPPPRSDFLETLVIGSDEFIPVIGNDLQIQKKLRRSKGKLDIIGYPENVFLGKVFTQFIVPRISKSFDIRWVAETGLTPAALQFALSCVGIAWVPRSLAQGMLESGNLVDLGRKLPTLNIEICALKRKEETAPEAIASAVWQWIVSNKLPL